MLQDILLLVRTNCMYIVSNVEKHGPVDDYSIVTNHQPQTSLTFFLQVHYKFYLVFF